MTLDIAVKEISKTMKKENEVGLLSLLVSLDQFSSYAQRGDEFKKFYQFTINLILNIKNASKYFYIYIYFYVILYHLK